MPWYFTDSVNFERYPPVTAAQLRFQTNRIQLNKAKVSTGAQSIPKEVLKNATDVIVNKTGWKNLIALDVNAEKRGAQENEQGPTERRRRRRTDQQPVIEILTREGSIIEQIDDEEETDEETGMEIVEERGGVTT